MISIEKLIELVNETLDELYTKDSFLFKNDSSERNLVFHFSRYFAEKIKTNIYLKDYNVDCEYNRNRRDSKKAFYGNEYHRIFPDFILHKRGTNEFNLLAIEFKKAVPYNKIDDEKLKYLTSSNHEYKYHLGLFISLRRKRNLVKIIKYINGEKYILENNKNRREIYE